MAIRKPKVSVGDARKMAEGKQAKPSKSAKLRLGSKGTTTSTPQAKTEKSPLPSPRKPLRSKTTPANSSSSGLAARIKHGQDRPRSGMTGPSSVQTRKPDGCRQNVKRQIFLSAYLPLPDVSPSVDQLSQHYPPAKALQMVLRRAMHEYEALLAGDLHTSCPVSYPIPDHPNERLLVQTSRVMPLSFVEKAQNHFDPLGFESARAVGFKLATAALATFFLQEKVAQKSKA